MYTKNDTRKWLVLGHCLFMLDIRAVENKPFVDWVEFRSLRELTENLNQIAIQSQVPLKVAFKKGAAKKVSGPILFQGTDDSKSAETPSELTRESTQAFSSAMTRSNLASSIQSQLPLPEARVLTPIKQNWSPKDVTESPLNLKSNIQEKDVLGILTPQTTSFGSDRYDRNLFNSANRSNTEANGQYSVNKPVQMPWFPMKESSQDGEKSEPKEKNEKDARESFQKTMKAFAERDDEKNAFQLVDYYDLRTALAQNAHVLSSFENDDFDERFVKNVQLVFERFGDRDNAPDKKSFELFLKRLQPPEPRLKSEAFVGRPEGSQRPRNHQR